MAGTFGKRTLELADIVGGKKVGKVEVDQVYAVVQHQGFWLTGPNAGRIILNHPGGGEAKFLEKPLFLNTGKYLHRLADSVLDGTLVEAMIENMEDLSEEVFKRAPRDFEDLRNSGHPTVRDGRRKVYDRPPVRGRLSDAALREKAKRKSLGEGR